MLQLVQTAKRRTRVWKMQKQSAQHRSIQSSRMRISFETRFSVAMGSTSGRLFALSGRRRLNQMALFWFYAITLSHRLAFKPKCALCMPSEEEPVHTLGLLEFYQKRNLVVKQLN